MWKFLTTLFVIVVSTSLIAADEYLDCKKYEGYEICLFVGTIKSVKQMICEGCNGLRLILDDVSAIQPYAFNTTNFIKLGLISTSYDCRHRIISTMPESFDGLSSLQELQLNCVVFTPTSNLFKDLTSLEELKISNIEFTQLPDNFLSYLPKLRNLRLYNLEILAITPNTFSGINPGLQALHLTDNNLKVVEDQSFQKLHELKQLEISFNGLTDLSPDMFDGLNALEELSLFNNKITALRNNTFSKLPQLTSVFLEGNKIREIEAGTFSGLPLKSLFLSANKLEVSSLAALKNLPNISELILTLNNIKLLRSNDFEGLESLTTLWLNDNMINSIESNAFQDLNLFHLTLDNNELKTIEPDTFNGLHLYGLLDLSNNDIIEIKEHAFRNLTATRSACILLPRNIANIRRDYWSVDNSVPRIVNQLFACLNL